MRHMARFRAVRRWWVWSLLAVSLPLALAWLAVEVRHRVEFGHFTPIGVHVDTLVVPGRTLPALIPGISHVLRARLANYGPFPVAIEKCWVNSPYPDEPVPGVRPFTLQAWDNETKEWRTPSMAAPTCEAPVRKWLWPLEVDESVDLIPGTHPAFHKGDWFRVVAATRYNVLPERQEVFAGQPFQLTEVLPTSGRRLVMPKWEDPSLRRPVLPLHEPRAR